MGVLTWKGATAKEALASEVKQNVPTWIKEEHLPPTAVPGAKLFAAAGCTACHTYDGAGGSNLGAPDLTTIGIAEPRHRQFQIKHLAVPVVRHSRLADAAVHVARPQRLHQLAIFLEASKGTH